MDDRAFGDNPEDQRYFFQSFQWYSRSHREFMLEVFRATGMKPVELEKHLRPVLDEVGYFGAYQSDHDVTE